MRKIELKTMSTTKRALGTIAIQLLVGLTVGLCMTMKANAQNWDKVIKTVASDREASDAFSHSVAISGDWAIIGAPTEDHDETGSNFKTKAGSAYIFKNIGGTWVETQKICASNRGTSDEFGCSVAIDGDYLVVGAQYDDHSGYSDIGSAYIFKNTGGTWSQTQRIVGMHAHTIYHGGYSHFGKSVSIDSNYLVVGAAQGRLDAKGYNQKYKAGAAHIFKDSAGVFVQIQKVVSKNRQVDAFFGMSVAIDGDYLVVGSPNMDVNSITNCGTAYIFEKNNGGADNWGRIKSITPSYTQTNQYFGYAVAIDNNNIVVGAYGINDSLQLHWSLPMFTLPNVGGVYVYSNNTGSWVEQQKIFSDYKVEDEYFGLSVAIDGKHIIVGARGRENATISPGGGGVIHPNTGAAFIFKDSAGTWIEAQLLNASPSYQAGELFGHSVAIDNDRFIVGARNNNNGGISKAGAAHFYKRGCSINNPLATIPDSIYSSAYTNTDTFGYTHYCSDGGELLLSLDTVGTGAVVENNQVQIKLGINKTYDYDTSGGIVTNRDGYIIMNRMWNINPTTQPVNKDVGVVFYFTNEEYDSLKNKAANHTSPTTISAVTDLTFYKGANNGFNYPDSMASGIIIENGTTPDTITWKHTVMPFVFTTSKTTGDHSAEFMVSSLSGGGGGVGAGDLPLNDTSFKIEVCLSSKVFLQGALYSSSNTIMNDDLRAANLIPTTEPYTDLTGFTHQGSGGGETTTPIVLATTGNDAIVDWIFIELRDVSNSSTVIETVSALVQRDGDIVSAIDGVSDVCFVDLVNDSVYVAIRHRNHLGVMAASPVQLTSSGTVVDFSTTTLYGTNSATTQNTVTALWAGDVNGDNKVLYEGAGNDRSSILDRILSAPGNTFLGGSQGYNYTNIYLSSDINMDGNLRYEGTNNERSEILSIILNHPFNTFLGGSQGFAGLVQQLP